MSGLTLSIGVVKNNADPMQEGRLQVWIPASDTYNFKVEDLPWARYVSPFGGVTADPKVGREHDQVSGITAYGFWAIPKNGAQVLVGTLESDPSTRFWMGCLYQPELNRTLPQAVEGTKTDIDESGIYKSLNELPTVENMREAGHGPEDPNYRTIGGYERSIAHPSNKNKNKPTDNGYAPKPHEPEKADSQMYVFKTPGGHYWMMSDIDERCRVRIRTTAGSQILIDDTNERIYISTARGRSYLELDEGSGTVNQYGAGKYNVHSENDINFYSDSNINLVAKKRINLVSEQRGIKIQGKLGIQLLSEQANIKVTASRDIHLKTTNGPTGSAIPEREVCSMPPHSGQPIGLLRDHAEEAGSSTSQIHVNAAHGVDIRADARSVTISGKNDVDVKAVGGTLKLDGSGGLINLSGGSMTTSLSSTGLKVGPIGSSANVPIETTGGAGGATAATAAAGIGADQVKPKMVVPKHESWDRSEDASCQPPRNAKYQG